MHIRSNPEKGMTAHRQPFVLQSLCTLNAIHKIRIEAQRNGFDSEKEKYL